MDKEILKQLKYMVIRSEKGTITTFALFWEGHSTDQGRIQGGAWGALPPLSKWSMTSCAYNCQPLLQRRRKLFQVVGAGQNFFDNHNTFICISLGLVSKSLAESGSVLDSSHSRRVLLEK